MAGFVGFLHKTEWLGMGLRILILEEHQNCMIGYKVTTILKTLIKWVFLDLEPGDIVRVIRGTYVAVAVAVCVSERLKVTLDM